MKKQIITISRQFGSGGHTVGKKVAEELGIPFYDQELVEKIAEESGYSDEIVEAEGEEALAKNRFVYNFVGRDMTGLSVPDRIWKAECKVIFDLAEKGPCVIVGRCADYLLRDRDDTLRVFIFADMEFREERIVELYGKTRHTPKHRIEDKDGKRAAHYRYYTGQKWGRAENFDICLNTAEFGVDGAADMITEIVKKSK